MAHISVCICTFRRPQPLQRLLHELKHQDTGGQFSYSIVVVDNDHLRSAEPVVSDFIEHSPITARYCVETRQNIARARNKAVENADGDYLAFIDDDEFPTPDWLLKLWQAMGEYKVDGVLGPVMPHFDAEPPRWVTEGRFHDRPMHPTGIRLHWSKCRTGNALLSRELFAGETQPFRPECLTGEDQDFFARMMGKGRAFVWCNEAVAYEVVPPARWTRAFLMRRALLRGMFSIRNYAGGFPIQRILHALIAVPVYGAVLPFALLFGQAKFMRYLFKLSYHLGRLMAFVGINPIRQYVAE